MSGFPDLMHEDMQQEERKSRYNAWDSALERGNCQIALRSL
jgi:hypothetical protein